MTPRALLLDVGQTLLQTAEPVGATYARIAARHGLDCDPALVQSRFRRAFHDVGAPAGGLRYEGDGRPFWRQVVARSVGSSDPALFEALYAWYRLPAAWRVTPGALPALRRLRGGGLKVALVSDWDVRLRPLLADLGLLGEVDHAAISCEVGVEKPDPRLFLSALEALGVPPTEAVHVGDDPARDARGARLAGCAAWTWGDDVKSFEALEQRLRPSAAAGLRTRPAGR